MNAWIFGLGVLVLSGIKKKVLPQLKMYGKRWEMLDLSRLDCNCTNHSIGVHLLTKRYLIFPDGNKCQRLFPWGAVSYVLLNFLSNSDGW